MLKSAFNIKINQKDLQKQTEGYMADIAKNFGGTNRRDPAA